MKRTDATVFNPNTQNAKWQEEIHTTSYITCLQEVIRMRLEHKGIKPKHFENGRPLKPRTYY